MKLILAFLMVMVAPLMAQFNGTVQNDRTTKFIAQPQGFWLAQPNDPAFRSAVRASQTNSAGGGGAITSVNGKVGVVVLSTTDIAEGLNRYWTDLRSNVLVAISQSMTNNPGARVNLNAQSTDVAATLSNASGLTNGAIPNARFEDLNASAAFRARGIRIGNNSAATRPDTIAFGTSATATATNAIAIGQFTLVDVVDGTAIGNFASPDRTNQIALGGIGSQTKVFGDLQMASGNGGNLTNIPAAQLTGSIVDARLSGNVARRSMDFQALTNTCTRAPTWNYTNYHTFGTFQTNAAFTMLPCVNWSPTNYQCATIFVKCDGSPRVITPAPGWVALGTWNCTNNSVISVFNDRDGFTNAFCLPKN